MIKHGCIKEKKRLVFVVRRIFKVPLLPFLGWRFTFSSSSNTSIQEYIEVTAPTERASDI